MGERFYTGSLYSKIQTSMTWRIAPCCLGRVRFPDDLATTTVQIIAYHCRAVVPLDAGSVTEKLEIEGKLPFKISAIRSVLCVVQYVSVVQFSN